MLLSSLCSAQIDLDRDGLGDVWQKLFEVTDGPSADGDGDGVDNRSEALAGTDPRDNGSFFAMESCHWEREEGSVCVRWSAVTGKRYRVEVAADLGEEAVWIELGSYDHRGPADHVVELTLADPAHGGLLGKSKSFVRVTVTDRDLDGDGVTAWEEGVVGSIDESGQSPLW